MLAGGEMLKEVMGQAAKAVAAAAAATSAAAAAAAKLQGNR